MKIRTFLPFFTFLLFAFQEVIYCSEHDFEGWVWRKTLNFKLPNDGNHFINTDVIHQKLADQVIELSSCLSKDGDGKKKNIAVLSLGVVLEDNEGNQCYTLLPCFDSYAFTSGKKKHPFSSSPEIIEKIKKYNFNDCTEYYLSLQEDIKIRKKRFESLYSGDSSIIGKQNIPTLKKEEIIVVKQHAITGIETLDGLGELNRIKGRHTDSEQKMLCLIEESLTDFPGWVLYLLNTTNTFITALEDYCSRIDTKRRYEIFSKKREILKLVQSQKNSEITGNTYEILATIVKLEKDIKTIIESNDALARKLYEATVEERLRTILKGYDATEGFVEDENILILRSGFWSKIAELIKLLEEDKGQHKKEISTEARRLKSEIKRDWKGKFSFIMDAQKVLDTGKAGDKYDEAQQNKKQEIDEIYKGIVKKVLESEPEPTPSNQNDEYLLDIKKVNGDLIPKISRILFDTSIKWDSIDLLYINETFLSIKALSDAVEDMVKLPDLMSSSDEALGYYFYIKDHIEKIKNGLLIKKSRMKGWLSSFHSFLERNDKKILGIVMHLHSYYDVCHFCGPSITRECEREDGIAAKLKHLCQNYNMDQTLPFFQVLFSCSEVRDHPEEGSRKDKYKDVHSDKTGFLIQIDPLIRKSIDNVQEKEPVFFQAHLPMFQ